MVRRIILKNYMSHAETVIDLADGLTVLVGPNNCGKSAVVSALQTLCENGKGDYMVRHGAKESSVTVQTSDGHELTWRRKGATVSYVVDGEEIHRVRGAVPEKLHTVLRLPPVESTDDANDSFDIHFGTQKDPIFLLNQPASKAAMFFAASSDASRLMEMQKLHKQKVRDTTRKQKELAQHRDVLDRQVAALAPVTELDSVMTAAEEQFEQSRVLEFAQVELHNFTYRLEYQFDERDKYAQAQSVLGPLRNPPELFDETPLEILIAALQESERQQANSALQLAALDRALPPPDLIDTDAIEILRSELDSELNRRAELDQLLTKLRYVETPPTLTSVADLESLVKQQIDILGFVHQQQVETSLLAELHSPPEIQAMDQLEPFIAEFGQVVAAECEARMRARELEQLELPPTVFDWNPLSSVICQLESVQLECQTIIKEIRQVAHETADVVADVEEWAVRHPVCDTCGGPVDVTRLLENTRGIDGAHSHTDMKRPKSHFDTAACRETTGTACTERDRSVAQ